MSTATKTFRARSLTDALVQVRDELGPDAVVVRRREGLEGGVAGFFQRAVVEIEAQPGGTALLTADAPGTSLLDDGAAIILEPMPAAIQIAPTLARDAATAGFAAALATAERTTEPADPDADADAAAAPRAPAMRPHTDAAVDAIPHPRDSAPEVVPVVTVPSTSPVFVAEPVFVPEPAGAPAPAVGAALAATPDHAEADRVAATLRRAGLSEAFSAAVLDEAMIHGLPFTDEGHTA
ncbi:MAG: hypothetical protein ACXVFM_02435, partial [Solirubrobacteraceae bacterium]